MGKPQKLNFSSNFNFKSMKLAAAFACILFYAPAAISETPCEESFNFKTATILIERSQKLSLKLENELASINAADNPSIAREIELFLKLKEYEYNYSTDYTMRWHTKLKLTEQELSHLREQFSDDHDFSRATIEDQNQFFVNHLRQLYTWYGNHLAKFLARKQIEESGDDFDKLSVYSQRVASVIVEQSLNMYWLDRSARPNELRTALEVATWKNLEWNELFTELVSLNADTLSNNRLIERAQKELQTEQPLCCQTPPGCRTCPLNNSTRR